MSADAGRPGSMRGEIPQVLQRAAEAARGYLAEVDRIPAGARSSDVPGERPLPSQGVGAMAALEELIQRMGERSAASTGPRYFHYVVGGVTPAALAADWIASAYDQVASSSTGSPVAIDLEELATRWLKELFDLEPGAWTGILTSGATVANFVGLGAARQWWGERRGVNIAEDGLGGLGPVPVLTGGFVHASVRKALAMLGIGRNTAEVFAADNRGSLDLAALEERLVALDGEPAILVATAGEVNAGGFDPIDAMADLAQRHGAWLHVDGAFGLFARVAPESAHLAAGVQRADSIAADAHKWLNVPYDSGVVFVRERGNVAKTFRMVADYLPPAPAGQRRRVPANLGPESSRRARALPIFATLAASGRNGVRAMVEGHLALARRLAEAVRTAPDLELVDEPCLNVVPFRFAPEGVRRRDLDALNARVAERVLEDGRVFVGTTRYRSVVCFRPAIANWSTQESDVDLLVEVVRKIGAGVVAEAER